MLKRKKRLIGISIGVICALLIVVLSLGAWLSVFTARVYKANKEDNIRFQQEHMEYLKNEFYSDYTPLGEQRLCDFDLTGALADGIKFNEVSFLATHNSYQRLATEDTLALYKRLTALTLGINAFNKADFEMDTLTTQLEYGIRSFELDVETVENEDGRHFVVMHKPILDSATSCYDFVTALEEIKLWSEHNPNHLPITMLLEPKYGVPALLDMKEPSLENMLALDGALKSVLGESLLTPSDMMGSYASLKEMRLNDGWLPLESTLGKVVVILHRGDVIEDYIAYDISMRSQAMFPGLSYEDRNEEYCAVILENEPKTAVARQRVSIGECNLYVRTRADSYPDFDDIRYSLTELVSSQIITSDYVPRTVRESQHEYSFGGYTVRLRR